MANWRTRWVLIHRRPGHCPPRAQRKPDRPTPRPTEGACPQTPNIRLWTLDSRLRKFLWFDLVGCCLISMRREARSRFAGGGLDSYFFIGRKRADIAGFSRRLTGFGLWTLDCQRTGPRPTGGAFGNSHVEYSSAGLGCQAGVPTNLTKGTNKPIFAFSSFVLFVRFVGDHLTMRSHSRVPCWPKFTSSPSR